MPASFTPRIEQSQSPLLFYTANHGQRKNVILQKNKRISKCTELYSDKNWQRDRVFEMEAICHSFSILAAKWHGLQIQILSFFIFNCHHMFFSFCPFPHIQLFASLVRWQVRFQITITGFGLFETWGFFGLIYYHSSRWWRRFNHICTGFTMGLIFCYFKHTVW